MVFTNFINHNILGLGMYVHVNIYLVNPLIIMQHTFDRVSKYNVYIMFGGVDVW